jgi:EmrB/QacA subfamily drug resistance transporter
LKQNKQNSGLAVIIMVYLAGIFMGAIDTGIVTPARTIIQNSLGVDEKVGIWMITIYTLAYAASIPVMGKLADRFGRKIIYMVSIFLFGFGSLMCGLSHYAGSFNMLIAFRAVQAIGGGGIVPIATAEFGTSFPPEKRGMALGLVGGVYGIANIFGSMAGSAILDLFGMQNWQYIFFVNIPITIFILIAGMMTLPNHKLANNTKLDFVGIVLVISMVLSLLYGLKNIDFFKFTASVQSTTVYPFLIAFVVLLPIFILVERQVQDPIINLKFFTNRRIAITLALSFAAGFVLMGIVFIPQFSENALKITSGKGGYFTVILGLLSGVSAMLSGKLIDKFGAKLVLLMGFGISLLGALFLILVAAVTPNLLTVLVSLMLLGFGLGFTMGAPINYMMLENITDQEANSGLAAVSLIRSIGTTIAPALMVGFLSHAGLSLQTDITNVLPNQVNVPNLPYVQDISDEINTLKSSPAMAAKLSGIELPDLSSMQTVQINFNGDSDVTVPDNIIKELQSSDVTTITQVTKDFASSMFDQMTPSVVSQIQSGLQSGIDGVTSGFTGLTANLNAMKAIGSPGMQSALDQMTSAQGQMQTLLDQMKTLNAAIPGAFQTAKETYLGEIDDRSDQLQTVYQSTLDAGYQQLYLTVVVAAIFASFLLLFYRKPDAEPDSTDHPVPEDR